MSIDYRSGIAYGYIVTESELEKAAEKFDMGIADLTEILIDEKDMLICLNSWCGGDYILGFDICQCDEGCAAYIDEILPPAESGKAELIELYQKYFGNKGNLEPRLITYLSVT